MSFKILVVYPYFGTAKGSWSTRMYELTHRWVKEGAEVEVITAPYEKSDIRANGLISFQEVNGVKLTVVNSGDSNRLSVISRALKAILFAVISTSFALTKRYDVILSSSGPITVGFPMIFAKILRNKKTVFEVRDLWPGGGVEMGLISNQILVKMAWWFEKQCYQNADLIVASSQGQKANILERYPSLKIEIIPNASDNDLFGQKSNLPLPIQFRNKILLTHIGSLGRIHNINFWILIAEEFKKRKITNIHFLFIGDGADRIRLENQIRLKQLNNCTFLGLKPKNELPFWLENSTATLFATTPNSVQDTCSPNKIFDSFAASKPIIQTSKGWIKELVAQEQCGLNINLDDSAAAAEKILNYVSSSKLILEHSLNAKRLAKTDFDRDRLARKYFENLCVVLR